jgi:hypothetical protein
VGAGASGLYLEVLGLLSAGHRPLLIPWRDVDVKKSKFLKLDRVVLTFSGVPGVALHISRKLGESVINAMPVGVELE